MGRVSSMYGVHLLDRVYLFSRVHSICRVLVQSVSGVGVYLVGEVEVYLVGRVYLVGGVYLVGEVHSVEYTQ